MTWIPKAKEIDAMLSSGAKQRYEYFIKRVCDTRKIWGLYDDGWASLGDRDSKLIPFWPHEVYADRFRQDGWQSYKSKEIELSVFLGRWIPGMKSDGVGAAIFPIGTGKAVVVSLTDLEASIRYELSESYDEEG